MKLRLAAPCRARRHRPPRRPLLHPRRRRPRRHRRADPPPRPRDRRARSPSTARPRPRRRRGRRPPGPPPRHHRRLDRPRRSGLGPPGRRPRPRRRRWWPGARTASGRSPPATSSPASSSRRSRPTRCSPRSGCPRWAGGLVDYQKFNRRAQDWAIVGVAVAGTTGRTGVALVNMGSTPLRATAVEEALAGGASAAEAAEHAADGTEPPTDLNASPEYRRHLGAGPHPPSAERRGHRLTRGWPRDSMSVVIETRAVSRVRSAPEQGGHTATRGRHRS